MTSFALRYYGRLKRVKIEPWPRRQTQLVSTTLVWGLSVLREMRGLLPAEHLLYFGDQAKVPYGVRPIEELQQLAEGVIRFLLEQRCKLVVIACNTASAAALKHLRELYPDFPIVGMEPAVKPAAEQTLSGKVGVLATPSTFAGALYASVVERFAHDVEVFQNTCPGLVAQIEKGYLATPKTHRILENAINPMLEAGVDTLVMGCTHFPFVIPTINQITAGRARVIDQAPAIARQLERVLDQNKLANPREGRGLTTYFTSSDPAQMQAQLQQLLGAKTTPVALRWKDGNLRPG